MLNVSERNWPIRSDAPVSAPVKGEEKGTLDRHYIQMQHTRFSDIIDGLSDEQGTVQMSFACPPIDLYAIGQPKGEHAYLENGTALYLKRLKPYASLTLHHIAECTVTPTLTREQVLAQEAAKILPKLKHSLINIALTEHGTCYTSEKFADAFSTAVFSRNPINGGSSSGGKTPIIVVIGGPLGLSGEILAQSQWHLSLSPMTYPHQMARLLFLEQLYRAFKILRNEPYHK